jgi:hypothetical protein
MILIGFLTPLIVTSPTISAVGIPLCLFCPSTLFLKDCKWDESKSLELSLVLLCFPAAFFCDFETSDIPHIERTSEIVQSWSFLDLIFFHLIYWSSCWETILNPDGLLLLLLLPELLSFSYDIFVLYDKKYHRKSTHGDGDPSSFDFFEEPLLVPPP